MKKVVMSKITYELLEFSTASDVRRGKSFLLYGLNKSSTQIISKGELTNSRGLRSHSAS